MENQIINNIKSVNKINITIKCLQTLIIKSINKKMSVYSGFVSRQQENQYDQKTHDLIYILQKRILKQYRQEHVQQDKFRQLVDQIASNMVKLQQNKYLKPKLSKNIQQVCSFFEKQSEKPSQASKGISQYTIKFNRRKRKYSSKNVMDEFYKRQKQRNISKIKQPKFFQLQNNQISLKDYQISIKGKQQLRQENRVQARLKQYSQYLINSQRNKQGSSLTKFYQFQNRQRSYEKQLKSKNKHTQRAIQSYMKKNRQKQEKIVSLNQSKEAKSLVKHLKKLCRF